MPELSSIKLHEDIEEKLRLKLFAQDPGHPHEYNCFLCALISKNNDPIRQIILPPSLIEKEGVQWVRFLIGGLVWTYCISDISQSNIPDELFINRKGVLNIYYAHPGIVDFLTKTLMNILEPKLKDYPDRNKAQLRKFVEEDLWE